jgi:hypothetical protein
MKKSILSLCLLIMLAISVTAQEKPKREFLLSLSENTVEIKPGDSKEITVNLVRSNAFSKSKAKLGLSSALPAGISLTYSPNEGVIESSVAKITVTADAKPGTYTVLPNCVMNNKSKGTMLKVTVLDASTTAVTGK